MMIATDDTIIDEWVAPPGMWYARRNLPYETQEALSNIAEPFLHLGQLMAITGTGIYHAATIKEFLRSFNSIGVKLPEYDIRRAAQWANKHGVLYRYRPRTKHKDMDYSWKLADSADLNAAFSKLAHRAGYIECFIKNDMIDVPTADLINTYLLPWPDIDDDGFPLEEWDKQWVDAAQFTMHRLLSLMTPWRVENNQLINQNTGESLSYAPSTVLAILLGKHQSEFDDFSQSVYGKTSPAIPQVQRTNRQIAVSIHGARLPDPEWEWLVYAWGGKCAVCGKTSDKYTILAQDHWVPITSQTDKRPKTTLGNIVPLCHSTKYKQGGCNNTKLDRDALEWLLWKYDEWEAQSIYQKIQQHLATAQSRYDAVKEEWIQIS